MAAIDTSAAFLREMHSGDFDAADALLPLELSNGNDAVQRALADLHTHRHRWTAAAAALRSIATPDASITLRVNLCRNFAALQAHRPVEYALVLSALENAQGDYRPATLASGELTVGRIDGAGRVGPLVADPAAAVRQALAQLQPLAANGQAIAFLSVSDGHVLTAVVARPPTLLLGRQQPLFLIEADVQLVLTCLLVHDWTGPLGPIEQARVQWYVGPAWAAGLRNDLLTDRYLVFPQANVKQGGAPAAMEQTLVGILSDLGRLDAAAAAECARYYNGLTAADYATALRGKAGRPARVLLLTTRFSTVLQYSTRDAAEAMKQLGFDAQVLIEPTAHHGVTRSAIRRTLAEFKPDMIFQIDHHRFEHGDLFPHGLPFVNWIQDLLPHLMTTAAGRQVTPTDFVLTPSLQRWVDDFEYPAQQCLEFRKLTHVPPRPPAISSDARRVVYVSSWSQSAASVRAALLQDLSGPTRDLTAVACDRMIATYAAGESLASPGDVRRVLLAGMDANEASANEGFVRQTTTRLFDRLNNLLYRQQGLAWAAEACAALDLTLEIYGNGWADLPEFAPHARGAIDYGAPLEALTREAGVTLILEPFMALAHQRPLDALSAGGFCLVRDHPANHTTNEWIDLLTRANDGVADAKSLQLMLSGDDSFRFTQNIAACDRIDGSPQRIDHVATVRRLQHSGFLPFEGEMLPMLDRVTFDTADGLRQRLAVATRDSEYRTAIARRQRQCVELRYGYATGMARAIDFVADRLSCQVMASRQAA